MGIAYIIIVRLRNNSILGGVKVEKTTFQNDSVFVGFDILGDEFIFGYGFTSYPTGCACL